MEQRHPPCCVPASSLSVASSFKGEQRREKKLQLPSGLKFPFENMAIHIIKKCFMLVYLQGAHRVGIFKLVLSVLKVSGDKVLKV